MNNDPSNHKLTLAKTHDVCRSGDPQLTVVLIHGIASNSASFDKILDHFESLDSLEDVRFVTFDLLGAGQSEKSDDFKYDYDEQTTALHNAISELNITTLLVLVGHSMGTFITTRYTVKFGGVSKLILVSPPIYTKEDLANPAFEVALNSFREVVKAKNDESFDEDVFEKMLKNVVMDKDNYDTLAGIKVPTVLIYGHNDRIIASYNLPKILGENAEYLTAVRTEGGHGVLSDKFDAIVRALEEELDA